METYLTRVTDYLLTQSWQIALLVAVIAVASLVLRNKSAHVRYLLWLIVLAKCLVPPLLTIPLAILPQEKPAVVFEAVGTTISEPLKLPSAPVKTAPAPMVRERPTKFTIHEWLGAAWIVGAITFLIFNLLKAMRTNYWLWRKRKALPDESRRVIENLFSVHGIKSFPSIWLMDGISQPFVWGLLCGSIYLPANFLNIKKPEHQKSILGHELSHVIRFDAAVNFLQVIAQAIFWFHPFVWWANRKIRAEREKCCDEMAVARLNTSPKDYSTAILETLAAKHEQTRPVPSLAVAGPVKNIEERIKTMLRPGKKFYKRPSLVAATLILLVALLTVPTALVLTARAETKAAPESEAKPSKSLHQAAADGDIEQVKEFLSKGADVNKTDQKERTPLYLAARHGHKAVVELLLARGAAVNARATWGGTPLHGAARYGHRGAAELLIAKGANINAEDKKGWTPLKLAARYNHMDVAELLITKGVDVSTKTGPSSWTALHQAARGDNKDVAELLIAKGADVNAKSKEGWTPLHVAAELGHKDVTEILVAKGANVNAKDNDGVTPAYAATTFLGVDQEQMVDVVKLLLAKGAQVDTIHLAAFVGDVEKINGFLKQGIDVNTKDQDGRTPLHLATISGQKDMLGFLIGKGADVNAKTTMPGSELYLPGLTPLHLAVIYPDYEVVKLLIDNGANINAKTETPPFNLSPLWTPVIAVGFKIEMGFLDEKLDMEGPEALFAQFISQFVRTYWPRLRNVVELLLARGANVNEKGFQGLTLLHLAAGAGLTDAAELLIAHGADVNAKGNKGQTPLHIAVMEGPPGLDIDNKGVVKLLIAKGADVNAKDNKGGTALWYAKDEGNKEIVELLRKHGAKEEAPTISLHEAAQKGDIEQVKSLIEKGGDINAKNNDGQTPLHLASYRGHRDIAELLVNQGADVNAKDKEGQIPLHLAAFRNHPEIVGVLIANGADIEAEDKGENTPLRGAAVRGDKEVVELLLDKGADIENKNPLTLIAAYGTTIHFDVIRLLLDRGADIESRGSSDCTPLQVVAEVGRKEVAELLVARGAKVDAAPSKFFGTTYHQAMRGGHPEMVRWCLSKGMDIPPLHQAAYFGETENVRSLLNKGADVNQEDIAGFTTLHCAVFGRNKEIVQLLIDRGADVRASNAGHATLLLWACELGDLDIVKLLVDNGAQVNGPAFGGLMWGPMVMENWSNLHAAAHMGHVDVVEYLLDKGADIDAKCTRGDGDLTPLHFAARKGHVDVVRTLLVRGADANLKSREGRTALDFAREKNHPEVVELLRKHGANE